MRVYVVGKNRWCGPSTASMFADNGWTVVGDEILSLKGQNDVDLVVFTGGADIGPHLYGEENISSSVDENRDRFELDVYYSLDKETKKAGICRGGQLLNVLQGGKLIQHHGHLGSHREMYGYVAGKYPKAEFKTKVLVCHHQGIVVLPGTGVDEESLDWIGLENYREGTVSSENWPVYTAFFPGDNALCFQPHPEWSHEPTEKYFFYLLERHLGLSLNRFTKKAA